MKSNKKQTYFGKSIASGRFRGTDQIETFVGAPGYTEEGRSQMGAVYLSSNTNEPHFIPPFDDDSYSYQRFGYAMVSLDLNRDGIDDLVVSAPAYGKQDTT